MKKLLHIAQITTIILVLCVFITFHDDVHFTHRSWQSNTWLRTFIDIAIVSLLLIHVYMVVKNFNKSYKELGRPSLFEYLIPLSYFMLIFPDLLNWFLWFDEVGFYLYLLILFMLPSLFSALLLMKRFNRSNVAKK